MSLRPSVYFTAAAALVVLGASARVAGATGELWLDEIWSFRLAHLATSPLGVITALHHDNNHHLNTLYLYCLREPSAWVVYRLHVIAAGVGTIFLAGVIARNAGQIAALAAMTVTGGSFLLTLYASEARGYALAVFLAFLAVPLAERYMTTRRPVWAGAFSLAVVFGFLSHLTFLHAYLGLTAWTAWRATPAHVGHSRLEALVAMHGCPVLALAALYWIDLRHMVVGGGPILSAPEVIARALSLVLGGPEQGAARAPLAIAAAAAGVASLVIMKRAGSDLWVLFGVTIFAAPALTLAMVDSTLLYERYFLVSIAFLVLSYSWLVRAAARRSVWLAAALVAAFLVPNGVRIKTLIVTGRGSYMAALRHITERSTQRPATVGSDHDFRHGRLVEFYRSFVPGGSGIEYHTPPDWAAAGPEWMLLHSQESALTPAAETSVEGGRHYTLSAFYPYAGVSGWHLAVYHNALARPR